MKAPSSLYVHIPFCSSICGYCDFVKLLYRDDFAAAYLPSLKEEILSFRIPSKLSTIYVGGGTPSCLKEEDLADLLSFLKPYLGEGGEFTVEANPESLTPEKAQILARNGVNRVSLGMESATPRLLKLMGRRHDLAQVQEAVAALNEVGISNINLDLIYALPEESKEELNNDLEAALSLKTPHLSCYSLILEDSSLFHNKGIKEASSDEQAAQYEMILKRLREEGYRRYEVSNFAQGGHLSAHNLTYWRDEEYYGAGLGAAGYVNGIRYKNFVSLSDYLQSKSKRKEEEKVTLTSDYHYFLLTNLRLDEGFSLASFQNRFGVSFLEKAKKALPKLVAEGLMVVTPERVYCTDRGLLILDQVLLELF